MRSLITASVLFITALLTGCISTSDPNAYFSTVRVYPMAKDQYMITCVDSPGYCAQQASRYCPQGFQVSSNTSNPADHGRMTMIIKCDKPVENHAQ